MVKYKNLNQSLIGLSELILKEGRWRETRGFRCMEYPEPLVVCIENPSDRYINIKERKWNKTFGFIESLWIAAGVNSMDMVGAYVKNMYTFSDDQQFMRAGYGPRIRAYTGISQDYKISSPLYRNVFSGFTGVVDQLSYVIQNLRKDINSRQAMITIHDPVKDDFTPVGNLKDTKDTPCCRSLQFMVVDGKLNLTLYIRSNDLIWGYSAVNVFNFTLMQEYVASMIGVPVGKYYHVVNNLHFYEDKLELVKALSKKNPENYESKYGEFYYYEQIPFERFDTLVTKLFFYEEKLREGGKPKAPVSDFEYTLFIDWATVIYNYWRNEKGDRPLAFNNPYLNDLFNIQ